MRIYPAPKPENEDERGRIVRILSNRAMDGIRSVMLIESKKGSIRGNHYHLKEAHYMYVLRGNMVYYERPAKTDAPLREIKLMTGDMVYTEPRVTHAVRFLADSSVIYFSTEPRNQASYRRDTKFEKIL